MSLANHLQGMARNNAWSNDRLLRACAALTPDAFAAPRTGFFPSLRLTLNHILTVDWYYIDALEEGGRGVGVFAVDTPFPDFPDLDRAQRESDRRLIAFCDRLDGADLSRTVLTERDEGAVPERIDRLLLHLFQHQIHHRGQAHAMLSGTAAEPPQLDEYFLDYDRHRRADEVARLGL